mgnify:CR=1 FL=1
MGGGVRTRTNYQWDGCDLAFRRGDLKTWNEQLKRPGRENDELLKAGIKQAEQDIEKYTVLLRDAKKPVEQFWAKGNRAKKLEKDLPAMFVELRVVQDAEADACTRGCFQEGRRASARRERRSCSFLFQWPGQ